MALPPVIARISAEAGRVYSECLKNSDINEEEGFIWKMTSSFAGFGNKLMEIFQELNGAITNYIAEIDGLTDPMMNPKYLHLQASVPRKADEAWQLVIPNQENQEFQEKIFVEGKGRIHCIGLSGSYMAHALQLKVVYHDEGGDMQRERMGYFLPIASGGSPTGVGLMADHFWHAYGWTEHLDLHKTISHATAKFYHFERFGYTRNSKKVNIWVKGENDGIFYSTAMAWESDIRHEEISEVL